MSDKDLMKKERREKESKELYAAVVENNVMEVESLLKMGISDLDWQNEEELCKTAMMVAIQEGFLEILNLLIKSRANVNLRRCDRIFYASQQGHLEICKLLIEAGAKVDLQNNRSATALMAASRNGYIEISKLLMEAGSKIDLQSDHEDTALSFACIFGYQDVASFLLAEGAAYTFKNDEGETAGYYAVKEHGWNWKYMIAEANLSFFDHVFDCMANADDSPIVEKKEKKRKRGEEEEEKKEELPFLLRFMKRVYFSDFMMSKYIFPKLSFSPGAEAGKGAFE